MTRFTICLLLIVGIIATIEAAGLRSGFGQSSAQAQASASSGGSRFGPPAPPRPAFGGGKFGPPAPPPPPPRPAFGGRGISNGIGNRGIGGGTSISIAKSVSINRGPGGSSSQAGASALSRGK